MIPKTTDPLAKDIRTGEGLLEWGLATAITTLTATGTLGVTKGATYLTVVAALKGIRRGLLKVAATRQPPAPK